MQGILLDTNILIDYLHGVEKSGELVRRIRAEKSYCYISTITEAEIFSGKDIKGAQDMKMIDELLNLFLKAELTSQIAQTAGLIRGHYNIKLADAAIAATAVVLGYKLLTKNISDFKRISGLDVEEPY